MPAERARRGAAAPRSAAAFLGAFSDIFAPLQEWFTIPPENTDVRFYFGGLRQPTNLQMGEVYSGHNTNR